MGLIVPPHISFCECQGRFILLDLLAERYFALSEEAASGLRNLCEGRQPSVAGSAALTALVERGVLVPGDAPAPQPCQSPARATRSLAEADAKVGLLDTAWALARLAQARSAIRRKPLRRVLSELTRRKARRGSCEGPEDELLEVAAAFRRCGALMAPLDQCLPRSIAAAHMLLDRSYRTQLVLGVRIQPFAAHCWLQSGSSLVNETLEEARNFTPILVI